jgi:hypothetical protein
VADRLRLQAERLVDLDRDTQRFLVAAGTRNEDELPAKGTTPSSPAGTILVRARCRRQVHQHRRTVRRQIAEQRSADH